MAEGDRMSLNASKTDGAYLGCVVYRYLMVMQVATNFSCQINTKTTLLLLL